MPMMIAFDKVSYSPGAVVSGHVVIVRKSPEKVKGLTMRFIGRSSKLVSDGDSPVKNYKKEVYFDEKVDIFGHDGSNTLLKVGETLFPFTFSLPHGLPSSFMWSKGNILYFVEAKLTRSTGWKEDKRVSCRLSVEGIFDLNLDPLAIMPAEVKRHKYVQHLLSKSGPVGFTFKITRSGFVRGHTIPFHVEIKNLSKVDAKKLKIFLTQEVNQDGKISSAVVEEMKGPAVQSGEIQSWEARMKVPSDIPATNLGNILNYPVVVSVHYFINIELSLKSSTMDSLTAKVPVTIGTISLIRARDRMRLQQLQQLQLHGSLPGLQLHDQDCPMSQSLTTSSQFSPNSLSHNHGSGFLVQSSLIVTPTGGAGNNENAPVILPMGMNRRPHLCNPNVRHLQYMMEHGSRMGYNGLPPLRPLHNYIGPRRARHHRELRLRESPPPSYDEVVGEDREDTTIVTTATTTVLKPISNNTSNNDSSCGDQSASNSATSPPAISTTNSSVVTAEDSCQRQEEELTLEQQGNNADPNVCVPVPQLEVYTCNNQDATNNENNNRTIIKVKGQFSSSSSDDDDDDDDDRENEVESPSTSFGCATKEKFTSLDGSLLGKRDPPELMDSSSLSSVASVL